MPMPLDLSLASPILNAVVDTAPNPRQLELLPSADFPLLAHMARGDSVQTVNKSFNLQDYLHVSTSCPSPQRVHTAWACDEHDQMPSSSQCKVAISIDHHDISLTLALAQDTAASSNDKKRAYADRKPSINYPEHVNVPDFDADRILNEGSSRGSEDEDGRSTSRKKLRLSKEESALLEERFKEQSTLTPKQKNSLARQLNLRPRQIEVWFQNRRARTKLKQMEVDYELLKKCCASLTEENRRLQSEVAQLRILKVGPHSNPHGLRLPTVAEEMETKLLMCPQCQCISTRAVAPSSSTTTSNSSLYEAPACALMLSPQRKTSPALIS